MRGRKPLKSAIDYLDEIGFTCYWAGSEELWRITDCWHPHYDGIYWSNVACANRRLVPVLVQKMETLFLETVHTTLHPKVPIDVDTFQIHNEFRYDNVSLCNSDGTERYQLTVVDRHFGGSMANTHHTCVWLDPPLGSKSNRREELQEAAKHMGCIRLIAVDRKPPDLSVETLETELLHFAKVLAQQGLFMGQSPYGLPKEIHFFHNETALA